MNTFPSIDPILVAYCDRKIADAAQIDVRYQALWQEIKDYLLNGGKRMRPRLVLLGYEAYKGHPALDDTMLHIAAAWELLHASLLVHDDIIDRDVIRHGKPNIAGRYNSIYSQVSSADVSHYSLSAALLGGNLLLMGSYEMIAEAEMDSDMKFRAQEYITKAIFTVAGGELIDTDSVLYPLSSSNPYAIAKHKTASYSLQMPLECGASMAAAPKEELEKISAIGLHAGIAYQLKDDLLGVFGDSEATGKSNRSDIVEKKQTQLIHETIKLVGTSSAKRITELYSLDRILSDDEAEEIVALIAKSDARDCIEQMIVDESNQALSVIETLIVDDAYKEMLSNLVNSLVSRQH